MLLATSATDESHSWLSVGLLDAESGCATSCRSSFACPQFVCPTPRTAQRFSKCTLIRSRRQVSDAASRSQVFMTNELGTNELGTTELGTNELGANELGANTSDDDSTQKFCRNGTPTNGTPHLPCRTHCHNLTAPNIYSHLLQGAQDDAVLKVDAMMRERAPAVKTE